MSNLSYNRSANRERALKKALESIGWLAVRTAGSHGIADVIALRPSAGTCSDPDHFIVRLIQVKTSQKVKEQGIERRSADAPFGPVNLEWFTYPSRKRKQ